MTLPRKSPGPRAHHASAAPPQGYKILRCFDLNSIYSKNYINMLQQSTWDRIWSKALWLVETIYLIKVFVNVTFVLTCSLENKRKDMHAKYKNTSWRFDISLCLYRYGK